MRGHFPLYVIVFISGAVVLVIEIVGTRVLGPFYGVSLYFADFFGLVIVFTCSYSGHWTDGP